MRREIPLTPEQEKDAEQIFQQLQTQFHDKAREIARLMASKTTENLFGKTEFELRDTLHELGAQSLESVLQGRKKGGTKDPA